MENALLQYLPEIGVLGVLVVSSWWWTYQREQRMAKRLDELEDYIRREQAALLRENQTALSENTTAFRRVIEITTELTRQLRGFLEAVDYCREVTARNDKQNA